MNEIINTLLRASAHQFIGRLGRDPEGRYFENGNCVVNTSIGINRPGAKKDDGQEPDWIKLELWGEEGQRFADTCRKGQEVHVIGRVKTDRWTDRNSGQERVSLVCIVRQWNLLEQPTQAPAQARAAVAPAAAAAPAAALPEDDEIPF
mgnify:CR=1 FL=1